MDATEFLKSYKRAKAEFLKVKAAREMAYHRATSVAVDYTRVKDKNTAPADRTGDSAALLADLYYTLVMRAGAAGEALERVCNVIYQVNEIDTVAAEILLSRWVKLKTIAEVAEEMNLNPRYILKKHAAILKEVQKIINNSTGIVHQ